MVDLLQRVDLAEVWLQSTRGLRFPKHEIALVAKSEREEVQRASLQVFGEVDKHVSAQAQVNAREGRALREIVLPEDGHRPDILSDLIRVPNAHEITFQHSRRDFGDRALRIHAAAREGNRICVKIGRENADVDGIILTQQFRAQNSKRVRFFARRCTGRPNAQIGTAFACVCDQLWQNRRTKFLEKRSIAKELRDLDEKRTDETREFIRVLRQEVEVFGYGRDAGSDHESRNAPNDRRPLVIRKVNPAALAQLLDERVEITDFFRG